MNKTGKNNRRVSDAMLSNIDELIELLESVGGSLPIKEILKRTNIKRQRFYNIVNSKYMKGQVESVRVENGSGFEYKLVRQNSETWGRPNNMLWRFIVGLPLVRYKKEA